LDGSHARDPRCQWGRRIGGNRTPARLARSWSRMIRKQLWRYDKRDGRLLCLELAAGPGDRAIDVVWREHAIRDTEKIEEPGGDLTHEQMLGRVLAAVAAPRHDVERGQSIHERQR